MLGLNHIAVTINGRHLLKDVSFDLQSGDLMVLLGGNGAGKSTLLKTIANSLPLAKGQIDLMGKDLTDYSYENLAQVRAVLSQNINLVFSMKVLDVVLLGRYPFTKHRGIPTTQDVALAYEILDLMGVVAYAEQDITTLSGGEQQRVHLARVLAQVWDSQADNPKLLLLDEPTSNLDIAYQHILLELLEDKVQKNGLAVLTILHDMNLAARYATKIALLKQGQLLTVGHPKQTLTPDWIQQTFGVSSIVQEHPIFDCVQISTY